MLPNSLLIYSQILPRKKWRYNSNLKAMERARKRINRGIRFFPVGLWVVCFSAFAVIDDPIIHIFSEVKSK
jgi:hypothetical protein